MGRGYMKVTSRVVRGRVSSLVANLAEPRTAINDLAQGRPRAASVTASRFLINSTVGGLGLFDVGGKLGLEGREGDFGQTLGHYGAKPRRYVVLPLMGPTTLRDGVRPGGQPRLWRAPVARGRRRRQSTSECMNSSLATGSSGPAAFNSLKASSAASTAWSMSASVMALVMNMLCQGWK